MAVCLSLRSSLEEPSRHCTKLSGDCTKTMDLCRYRSMTKTLGALDIVINLGAGLNLQSTGVAQWYNPRYGLFAPFTP